MSIVAILVLGLLLFAGLAIGCTIYGLCSALAAEAQRRQVGDGQNRPDPRLRNWFWILLLLS